MTNHPSFFLRHINQKLDVMQDKLSPWLHSNKMPPIPPAHHSFAFYGCELILLSIFVFVGMRLLFKLKGK